MVTIRKFIYLKGDGMNFAKLHVVTNDAMAYDYVSIKFYFSLIGGALSRLVYLFRELLLNQSILNTILWYVL